MRLPLPPVRLNRAQRAALWVNASEGRQVLATIVVLVNTVGNLAASGGLADAGHPIPAALLSVVALGWAGAGIACFPLRRSATRPCPGYIRHGLDDRDEDGTLADVPRSYELSNRRGDPEYGWKAYAGLRGPLEEAARPVYEAMLDACQVYLEDETEENGTPVARRLEALHRLADEQRRIDARVVRATLARDDGDLERVEAFLDVLAGLNAPQRPQIVAPDTATERPRRFRRVV